MMRRLRFLLALLLLAAAPSVRAQGPANDLCANDDKACHKGRADAMWLELWQELPDAASGLVLEPVQSALGLDTAGQWRVSARRGTDEIGSGTFLEAAGGRHFLSHDHQVQPDGTPVDVTIEWVVGTLTGPAGGSRGVLGMVVRTVVPSFTSTVLQPVTVDPDLGSALGRARPLLLTEVGRKTSGDFRFGDLPLPPAYSYAYCLFEPGAVDAECGEPYCDCRSGLLGDLTVCSAAIIGALGACTPSLVGGPPTYYACVLGVLSSGILIGTGNCPEIFVSVFDEFDQCREAADRCYCNLSPLYPYLCGNETLSVGITGLRAGESVRVNGSCQEPGAPNGVTSSVVATPENNFFDLIECGIFQNFTIETEPVDTPGTPSGQARQCTLVGPPVVNVPVPDQGRSVIFDCTCQSLDECRQGRVDMEVTVSGLRELPPTGNTHVEIHGTVEYISALGDLESIPVTGSNDGNGHFLLLPQVYAGLRVTWPSSQNLPPGCQVSYNVPNGGTLPTPPPYHPGVTVAEVTCVTCNQPGGCQVTVQVAVSGATRPGGIPIQVLVGDHTTLTTQVSNGITTVTQAEAGDTVDIVVNQPIKQLGPGRIETCDVSSPGGAVVPATSPFVAAEIECTTDTNKFRPQNPPAGGGGMRWAECHILSRCPPGQYSRPCPPGVAAPGSDCVEVVAQPCYLTCAGAAGLNAFRVYRADSSAWLSGDQPPGATPVADDHLTVGAAASDEDGIQGFAFAIDDVYVGEHITGGHTAVSSGPIEIDTSGLAEGTHTFAVYALDNNPEMPVPSVSEVVFEVRRADPCAGDSAGPALAFSAPLGSGSLPLAPLDVYAEASDPNGVDYVQFYVDGAYQSSDGNWPYRFHWSPQPGTHILRARAADECGNAAEINLPVAVTDPCQGLAYPEVTITNLTDGAWVPPALYHVEAQATDHSGQGIASVTFEVGGLSSSTDTTAPYRSTGYFLTTLGPEPIVARAFDGCGRMASQAITINIDADSSVCGIDQGPPAVTITQPASGTTLPAGPTTITAQAIEDTVLYAWALWVDGRPVDTALVGTPTYQWTRDLGPGSHTIEVRAADVCLKTGRAAVAVTVGSSHQPLAWMGFAPFLRFLDGPTNPPGPPMDDSRLVDFGAILPGQPGKPRTISLLNDGGGDLEILSTVLSSTAFEIVSGGGAQTVPGFNGERFLSVRPTGGGDGLVEATLTVESAGAGGTFTRQLRVNVDPIDGEPGRFLSMTHDFESVEASTLADWTGVYGVPPTVTKASALEGERGMDVSFVGVTAQSFVHAALPAPKSVVRTYFRFNPNSVALPGGAIQSFAAYVSSGTPIAWLQVRQVAGGYEARVATRRDDGSSAVSAWMVVADGPERLTLDWWAASADGAGNGGARLRRADGTTSEVRGLDNDQQRSDRVRVGALWGVVEEMEGHVYFDDVVIQY